MKSVELTTELERDIIFGRLRPRERLVEDDLVARFGAKRHVVRAALQELEQLGIVVRQPNRGAQVRDYSPQEVEELYDMRAALHRLAIERTPFPFDPAVLRQLKGIQGEHADAIAANDLIAIHDANERFHDTLFSACGNRYLAEAVRRHAWLSHAIRSYGMTDPVMLAQSREEHEQMIAAIEAADIPRLADLCVRHIQPAKRAYLKTSAFVGLRTGT